MPRLFLASGEEVHDAAIGNIDVKTSSMTGVAATVEFKETEYFYSPTLTIQHNTGQPCYIAGVLNAQV